MVKNKEITMQLFLKAVDDLICEEGFEKLGINAVANRAGLSKMLIYRYFGSLEDLIAAYIKQHDFWFNFDPEFPPVENMGDFIKQMFQQQIHLLRNNYALRRLYRWELSSNNAIVRQLRQEREEKGKQFSDKIIELSGLPHDEVTVWAALLNSSISYLVMLEEFCPYYNGIPIQQDKGWMQIEKGIGQVVEHLITKIK